MLRTARFLFSRWQRLFFAFTITLLKHGVVLEAALDCQQIGPAVIKGKRFFNSRDGSYLPLRGINYYPRPNEGIYDQNSMDFFTEEFRHIWERDLPHLIELGINVIRLFSVDPSKNHDGFMCALREAGIYVIVGLAATCENCAVIDSAAPNCYPGELKTRGQIIINAFAKYENVLAFSAGNEVTLLQQEFIFDVAPCQKQFLRDMREYVRSCSNSMRQIPVGFAVADVDRSDNARYFNCIHEDDDDQLSVPDFYGMNVYLHYDVNDVDPMEIPGYRGLLESLRSYEIAVPVLLTEFGAPNPEGPRIDGYGGQRDYRQVDAIFSQEYAQELAGGLVFEYHTEAWLTKHWDLPWPYEEWCHCSFGVGYMSPENCNDDDIPCEFIRFPQYDNLKEKFSEEHIRLLSGDASSMPDIIDYIPTRSTQICQDPRFPAISDFRWESEDVEDWECPPEDAKSFICENTPVECLPPTMAPTSTPSNAPTPRPTPRPTPSPTFPPTVEPTPLPTPIPGTPTSSPTTLAPTPNPTLVSLVGDFSFTQVTSPSGAGFSWGRPAIPIMSYLFASLLLL